MMVPLKVSLSTMAAQRRGSVKVLVQHRRKNNLDEINGGVGSTVTAIYLPVSRQVGPKPTAKVVPLQTAIIIETFFVETLGIEDAGMPLR